MGQSVPRDYVRRMYIFDFPDRSHRADATSALRHGLKTAFKAYPHLTGRMGPVGDELLERDLVMLRYGDNDAAREITEDMFQASYRKKAAEFYSYRELCQMNMPVSHWKTEDFCIAPIFWEREVWVPAMTLKATFLGSGGLVLCFAFHHSLVDGHSISMFIDKFAEGIRDSNAINEETCDFDLEEMDGQWDKVRFPEMDFDKSKPVYPYPHSGRCRLVKFPAKVIAELKDLCLAFLVAEYDTDDDPYLSSVDVVSALMWVSLLRARHMLFSKDDYNETAVFTTAGLGWPGAPDYFGNMVMHLPVTACLLQDIVNPETTFCPSDGPPRLEPALTEDIAMCAHQIRRNLHLIRPDNIEDRLSTLMTLERPLDAPAASQRAVRSYKYGVKVGSHVHSRGADVDFGIPGTPDAGGGRPRFVRTPWMRDNGMVHIMPRRGGSKGDEDWVVLVGADSPVLDQLCSGGELCRWASGFVDDRDPSLWWERRFGARRLPIEEDDEDGDEDDEGDVSMK
ncbi:O-acetyltransferase [Apiospora phragmitis]|uniref:O-acetyltransferase n=1 Tax=Apiospora phragmitis TaxID=2905665 RepID=A0ABR1TPD0_9PEZI